MHPDRTSIILPLALALAAAPLCAQSIPDRYREVANRIIAAAQADSAAWNRMAELSDRFGNRLSGSPSLEQALDWVLAEMRRDGLENVRGEPVMVPHWVRGEESLELVSPRRMSIPMLGLGNSDGTRGRTITAEVLVVSSFEELERRAAEARGKIVLWDVPWQNYGFNTQYRGRGAIAAARAGAVASIIRSAEAYSIRSPHTGFMGYDSTTPHIPGAVMNGIGGTVDDRPNLMPG